jgi:sarcosine oxidase
MTTVYDAIVLGVGGIGSAAFYHLARRGAQVLGLDRFPAGHALGSSHGQTRIIRQAYFEHPDYVPLLRHAYPLWHDLERTVGQTLFHQVGLLEVGPSSGIVVPGVLEAARRYDLPVDRLTANEAARRFPAFTVLDDWEAVFERQAGFLLVEDCVRAHIEQAVRHGGQFRPGSAVADWQIVNGQVEVRTANERFLAGRLVIAGGAWSGQVLSDLGITFRVLRKHLHWYAASDPRYQAAHGCPAFFYELPDGYFYGFPARDACGVKAAEHSGGELVADPLTVDRALDPVDRQRVEGFLHQCLPGVSNQPRGHAVCMYTMTADSHFVVDRHPQHSQIALAAGLSGHGFKFATVIGQALAELALDGHTELPIDFLNCRRPALRT